MHVNQIMSQQEEALMVVAGDDGGNTVGIAAADSETKRVLPFAENNCVAASTLLFILLYQSSVLLSVT